MNFEWALKQIKEEKRVWRGDRTGFALWQSDCDHPFLILHHSFGDARECTDTQRYCWLRDGMFTNDWKIYKFGDFPS